MKISMGRSWRVRMHPLPVKIRGHPTSTRWPCTLEVQTLVNDEKLIWTPYLRYRQVDQTFLVEVNVQDRHLFDRAIGCLESAQRFWQTKGNDLRAEKCTALMQEIKNYM